MSKVVRQNWFIFLIFLSLCLMFWRNLQVEYENSERIWQNTYEYYTNLCQQEDLSDIQKKKCEEKTYLNHEKSDFYTVLTSVFLWNFTFLNGIAFLILCIPLLRKVCLMFKHKTPLNELTRQKYSQFLKKVYYQGYKNIWLFPVFLIVVFLLSYIYSSGFQLTTSLTGGSAWTISSMQNPILFISTYLLTVLLYCGFYLNIGFIIVRKNHHFFLALILTFLTTIGIQLFFEIVVNAIISGKLLNSTIGSSFNILNLFAFRDQNGLMITVVLPIIYFLISSFIVYFLYKDKEKFIIDLEKNN